MSSSLETRSSKGDVQVIHPTPIGNGRQEEGKTPLEHRKDGVVRRLARVQNTMSILGAVESDDIGVGRKNGEVIQHLIAVQGVLLKQLALYGELPQPQQQAQLIVGEVVALNREWVRHMRQAQAALQELMALNDKLCAQQSQTPPQSLMGKQQANISPTTPTGAPSLDTTTALFIRFISGLDPQERRVMLTWLRGLLKIADSDANPISKAYDALVLTFDTDTLWAFIKALATKLKEVGWDDRSITGCLGISGVLAGLTLFGGSGAGIAALGGAIGVPLWVVLGGGGLAIGAVIEEFNKEQSGKPSAVKTEQQNKG